LRFYSLIIARNFRLDRFWNYINPRGLFIDIGASYFFNQNWIVATRLKSSKFYLVDPNEKNLEYAKGDKVAASVVVYPVALSASGGVKDLFITNIDSGSTMYEPFISPNLAPRISDDIYGYFFPYKKVKVDTSRLGDLIRDEDIDRPIVLKIDAQGAEHDILLGASDLLTNKKIVAIELEASLLSHPFSVGGTKLSNVQHYLESLGYELVALKPIYSHGPKKPKSIEKFGYLSECDALFVLNQKDIHSSDLEFQKVAFFVLCLYGQFGDALALLRFNNSAIIKRLELKRGFLRILKLHKTYF
jgi:FkbM family methyltransferase